MKHTAKNSRLALCVLAIMIACLWWQAAFADIYVTLTPIDEKSKELDPDTGRPKVIRSYKLTVTGAPANQPITVYGGYAGKSDGPELFKGQTDDGGKFVKPKFPEAFNGLRQTTFKIVIGTGKDAKTYENIQRPGGRIKAKEDRQGGGPGNVMFRPNALPFDIGASVCVASAEGAGEMSASLELANLSASESYAFLSLRVYRNLGSEYFAPAIFDTGPAIVTGTLSLDPYADNLVASSTSQTRVTEVLANAEDAGSAPQEVEDACLAPEDCVGGGDALVLIGPNTGDDEPSINLGSDAVAPDSYDLVIGMAAPVLDDSSLGEPFYFAFAHACQVEAAAVQSTDGEQMSATGGAR